jgi:hypothetical protein
VNIEAPFELDDDLRWFYGEVAELEEVLCDGVDPPRLCFKSGQIEIRVHLMDRPRIEPVGLRLTITVPSLTVTTEKLDERSLRYQRLTGTMYTDRRLETLDPAGNRVALKQGWPAITI